MGTCVSTKPTSAPPSTSRPNTKPLPQPQSQSQYQFQQPSSRTPIQNSTNIMIPAPGPAPFPNSLTTSDPNRYNSPVNYAIRNSSQIQVPKEKGTLLIDPLRVSNNLSSRVMAQSGQNANPVPDLVESRGLGQSRNLNLGHSEQNQVNIGSKFTFQQNRYMNQEERDSAERIHAYLDSQYQKPNNNSSSNIKPQIIQSNNFSLLHQNQKQIKDSRLENSRQSGFGFPGTGRQAEIIEVIEVMDTLNMDNPMVPYSSSYKPSFAWAKEIENEDFDRQAETIEIPDIRIRIS